MNSLITLDKGNVSYILGKDALEKSVPKITKYNRVIIITDGNVFEHCLPLLKSKIPELESADIIITKFGEENKSLEQLCVIWDELTKLNADRDDLIINLGGGVVTDIGGMAAGTFKRGLTFVNIPTTLLGMVDAAIGGKTGIDYLGFKNQVGLFVSPSVVVVDPLFLSTLEHVHWQSGFAEVLKYGLIMDNELWHKLDGRKFTEVDNWNYFIIKAARNKIDIVEFDKMEKGIRKNLNFGHTIGHAIESYYLKTDAPVTHGMAIAAGMICETWISSHLFNMECKKANYIVDTIDNNFGRLKIGESDLPEIMTLMKQDKKVRKDKYNFSLLRKIGKAVHDVIVDDKLIVDSLNFYINKKTCE